MNIPVIIGSGINGLAVSRRLSYCQISHYLIGEPIKESRPQLGESMDPVCTVEMEDKWSNFQQFFYPKQKAIFYTDGWVTTCDFNFVKQKKLQIFFQILGLAPPTELIHVDRACFDRLFFAETIANQNCQYLPSKVQSVIYDKETEKITQLLLEDGTNIQPSYVFDCSNHARVLAKEINIPYEILGKQQKVVFAHLEGNPMKNEQKSWLSATTLIKTEKKLDGIDGFGWCIPLGKYLSVGISCDLEDSNNCTDADLLELFLQACQRRNLDISENYPQKLAITAIKNIYYAHQRFNGENWLLLGPSACQIWFPSGSAVGFSLFAACLSEQFIKASPKALQLYQSYINSLKKSHQVFEQMRYQTMDASSMNLLSKQIFIGGGIRLAAYALARENSLIRRLSWWLKDSIAFFYRYFKFCSIAPMKTENLLENLPEIWQPVDEKQKLVSQIMEIVSGKEKLSLAPSLIEENLAIEISGTKIQGIKFWYLWLKAAKLLCPYQELQLSPIKMETFGDVVQTTAQFRAYKNNTLICSDALTVRHRVVAGKVTEISTKWENYEFIFQPRLMYKTLRPVLALLFAFSNNYFKGSKKKYSLPPNPPFLREE